MSNALSTLTQTLATKLNMGDGSGLIDTLKATAFKAKEGVSDAQMTALMVVANQYGLNPWTKEIYAYPDKQNGIVPVVGLDGWSRIINSNPQFDGMDFEQSDDSCTCTIYRKDRTRPVRVTEYHSECYRAGFKKDGYEIKGPWQSHPKRMLRHKAMIQCARLAFGFGGIYDQDEAERIVEASAPIKDMGQVVIDTSALRFKWMGMVYASFDESSLEDAWKNGIAEIRPTNDMSLYADFKQAVIEKKSTFAKSDATETEAAQ